MKMCTACGRHWMKFLVKRISCHSSHFKRREDKKQHLLQMFPITLFGSQKIPMRRSIAKSISRSSLELAKEVGSAMTAFKLREGSGVLFPPRRKVVLARCPRARVHISLPASYRVAF